LGSRFFCGSGSYICRGVPWNGGRIGGLRRGRSTAGRRVLRLEDRTPRPTRDPASSGCLSLAAAPVVGPPGVFLAVLDGGLEVFVKRSFGPVCEFFEDLVELQHVVPGVEVA
jgi:hypothetical protein